MFARILKSAPFGNQNAKGHGGASEKPTKPKWVDPRGKSKDTPKQPPQPQASTPSQESTQPDKKKGVTQGGQKSLSGYDVMKLLEKEGWEFARNNGHQIMKKHGHKPVPIPNHNKDLGIGLLKALQKQTGITF